MRRLTMICGHIEDLTHTWMEEYIEGAVRNNFPLGHPDPEQWARDLIDQFNRTLRYDEKERRIISISVTPIAASEVIHPHTWEKLNTVTIIRGSQIYDSAKCTVCGVTGKRFGLGKYTLDSRYARFESCIR